MDEQCLFCLTLAWVFDGFLDGFSDMQLAYAFVAFMNGFSRLMVGFGLKVVSFKLCLVLGFRVSFEPKSDHRVTLVLQTYCRTIASTHKGPDCPSANINNPYV